MNIVTIDFPEKEYIKEASAKDMIVLHHTVSSSGAYVDDWWKDDNGKSRVAAAFIVEKNGSVYQLFDPSYWAYHIGKGSKASDNKRSIAIEIVNEGILTKQGNNYYWNDGTILFNGEVYTHPEQWRGGRYFAAYTKEQYKAVSGLLTMLCTRFNIPRDIITSYLFAKEYFHHHGVVSHHNLRSDKSDVSVAFEFGKVV